MDDNKVPQQTGQEGSHLHQWGGHSSSNRAPRTFGHFHALWRSKWKDAEVEDFIEIAMVFRRFVDWFWVLLSYQNCGTYGHQVAVQFCRARVDARGRRMGWDGGGIRQQKSEQLFVFDTGTVDHTLRELLFNYTYSQDIVSSEEATSSTPGWPYNEAWPVLWANCYPGSRAQATTSRTRQNACVCREGCGQRLMGHGPFGINDGRRMNRLQLDLDKHRPPKSWNLRWQLVL